MRPGESDTTYLWDMEGAAREAKEYLQGLSEADFLASRLRQRAVERAHEVLGEAAGRVGKPLQDATPQIDWRRIIGQRNIIAHRYSKVDYVLLYRATRDHIPELLKALRDLLAPEKES